MHWKLYCAIITCFVRGLRHPNSTGTARLCTLGVHWYTFGEIGEKFEEMRFIVELQLVVLVILVSFRLSDGVKCTTDALNPCRCILSDGASGVVDISPLFSDGSLFCQQFRWASNSA